MQAAKLAILTMAGAMVGITLYSPLAAARSQPQSAPSKTHIIEQAPKDRSIAIPTEKLAAYYRQMDAAHEATLRMVEGGKFSVNLRRVKAPEASPLTNSRTIDLWYVLAGSGSVTTGGKGADGKVTDSVTDHLMPGDVEFIPANLPRHVSEVGPDGITWLDVRWDMDWKGPMGAGKAPVPGVPGDASGDPPVAYYATSDRAVHFPKDMLNAFIAEQNSQKRRSQTERLIEGGHFNINIRNVSEPTIEFHKTTVDTWVVLQGSGTAITGFSTDAGGMHIDPPRTATRVAGSGVEVPAKVGDIFFVPSGFTHGFSAVNPRMVWLNIRWDDNYGAK
jgi:mannose-6-phosphate isomerase-like protein (cupin superfamily)